MYDPSMPKLVAPGVPCTTRSAVCTLVVRTNDRGQVSKALAGCWCAKDGTRSPNSAVNCTEHTHSLARPKEYNGAAAANARRSHVQRRRIRTHPHLQRRIAGSRRNDDGDGHVQHVNIYVSAFQQRGVNVENCAVIPTRDVADKDGREHRQRKAQRDCGHSACRRRTPHTGHSNHSRRRARSKQCRPRHARQGVIHDVRQQGKVELNEAGRVRGACQRQQRARAMRHAVSDARQCHHPGRRDNGEWL